MSRKTTKKVRRQHGTSASKKLLGGWIAKPKDFGGRPLKPDYEKGNPTGLYLQIRLDEFGCFSEANIANIVFRDMTHYKPLGRLPKRTPNAKVSRAHD